MIELISNPFGFAMIWFDIGLLLMIFGEYWFTVRKGYDINIDVKYIFIFFILSFLGPIMFNRIVTESFEKYPVFFTHISYDNDIIDLDVSHQETIELND